MNEFISDSKFPIVPISAKKQLNINNLLLEIENKINTLTGKEIKELRINMDNYDKVLSWIKE